MQQTPRGGQKLPNATTSVAGSATPPAKDTFKSSLRSFTAAVEAGDMETAQSQADALQGDRGPAYTRQQSPGRGPASVPAHSNSRWNRQADFQDLVAAVRLGDATAAQEALAAFNTKGREAPTEPVEDVAVPPTTPVVDETPIPVNPVSDEAPVSDSPVVDESPLPVSSLPEAPPLALDEASDSAPSFVSTAEPA